MTHGHQPTQTASADKQLGLPSTPVSPCPWCGLAHAHVCHLVKAFEYHPDGTLKRVEFKGGADFALAVAPLDRPRQSTMGVDVQTDCVVVSYPHETKP
jgi:hypothetical protein